MSPLVVLGFVAYILASLTTIGMMFDGRPGVCLLELARCGVFVAAAPRACGLLAGAPCALLVPVLQVAAEESASVSPQRDPSKHHEPWRVLTLP